MGPAALSIAASFRHRVALGLRIFLRKQRVRGWSLILAYLACELVCLWRFRLRMARLRQPRRSDRRGTLEDLQWLVDSAEHPICPINLSKESMEIYLKEKYPDRKQGLDWKDVYATVRDAFCLAGPSAIEHAKILRIITAMAKQQGIKPPPADAKPPARDAPLAFGSAPLQVVHKPLPVEAALSVARWVADALFLALGFRQRWLPTPEGWLRYWSCRPREADPAELPAVFIHGVGLGAAPYLHFIDRLRRGRRAPLVVLELPNCSRSNFQEVSPSVPSFRDAFERLLLNELQIAGPGRYVLIGHSLGTDYCSMVMNDPRMPSSDPVLRPARLVLLDPICFVHEIAEAHRLPFWTFAEARRHAAKAGIWWPLMMIVLLVVIRDEYNQEGTKRAIVPGTDSIFRCSHSLLQRCPTLVVLSGNDVALPAWKVYDYVRAQFPEVQVRIDPGLEHGGFLMPWNPWWLSRAHAEHIIRFLASDASLPFRRVGSQPDAKREARRQAEKERPIRRKTLSESTLLALQ